MASSSSDSVIGATGFVWAIQGTDRTAVVPTSVLRKSRRVLIVLSFIFVFPKSNARQKVSPLSPYGGEPPSYPTCVQLSLWKCHRGHDPLTNGTTASDMAGTCINGRSGRMKGPSFCALPLSCL